MTNVRSITPNDPANFTPELGDYKTLQPFRYWCHKVLPLVYDDSLSYYELLCKVVDYLNKAMEDVETLHGDVTNLHTSYDKLQSYVNNYFSSLDVQEEINNKLDNMADSGELYEIITRYTDPIVNEQNKKINVLEARMNTFASLPSGSTTGNAELLDIRVKADGSTATTAGNAVRQQVSELNTELDNSNTFNRGQIVYGKNRYYYDKERLISDYYIEEDSGSFKAYSGWYITDFIPVDANAEYIFAYYSDGRYMWSVNNYYARYDKNFKFISTPTSTEERKIITTDSNTAYVRISQMKERFSPMSILVEKTLFDVGIDNYIPFSMEFIGENAVKQQVSELNTELDNSNTFNRGQIVYGKNRYYYDKERLISDYYIEEDSGSFKEQIGWYITDFIPVDANAEYKFAYYSDGRYVRSNNNYYARYDKNFKFISTPTSATERNTITTDSNTAYVRISQMKERFSHMSMLVEKTTFGDEIDRYIPFSMRFIGDNTEVNNDKIMRSICRMGEAYGQPESVSAMIACKNAGFNIIRVNLQYTSDNIPVLWHDQYINQHMKVVYNSNDVLVPYSETNRIKISETPLAILNQYKWGNKTYTAGIPTAEAIIKSARKVGIELYFENKMTLSEYQISNIISLVKKYGMQDRVSFIADSLNNAQQIATHEPRIRVGSLPKTLTESVKVGYIELKKLTNNIFWWGWDSTMITSEMVEFLSTNGIEYECGDFNSYSEIESYLSTEYAWYCTGMEIQGKMSPLIGQYIENNLI